MLTKFSWTMTGLLYKSQRETTKIWHRTAPVIKQMQMKKMMMKNINYIRIVRGFHCQKIRLLVWRRRRRTHFLIMIWILFRTVSQVWQCQSHLFNINILKMHIQYKLSVASVSLANLSIMTLNSFCYYYAIFFNIFLNSFKQVTGTPTLSRRSK